jgi:hypothetical protein
VCDEAWPTVAPMDIKQAMAIAPLLPKKCSCNGSEMSGALEEELAGGGGCASRCTGGFTYTNPPTRKGTAVINPNIHSPPVVLRLMLSLSVIPMLEPLIAVAWCQAILNRCHKGSANAH